jgi:ferric-dicitrate binding protein FerR (iron transport regulator)
MPLRKFRFDLVPTAHAEAQDESPSQPERRNLWRSGLLIATSAAFGGIAVAIWNRRTLAKMRQQPDSDER